MVVQGLMETQEGALVSSLGVKERFQGEVTPKLRPVSNEQLSS